MKIGDLPTPGTPRWFDWRNSCLTIETWLAQEAAKAVVPLHEPFPAAPTTPPAAPTQQRATSAVLGATGPVYGEPQPINPHLDPADPTRSHPSGGPLLTTTPAPNWQRDDGHTPQKRRTKGRVRRDTEAEIEENPWW